jgi:hypothetical protein
MDAARIAARALPTLLLAVLLVAGCREHAAVGDPAPDAAPALACPMGFDPGPAPRTNDVPVTLATLNGETVTVDDFLTFLSQARPEGYRPATSGEAARLVRAYLAERLVAAYAHGAATTSGGGGFQALLQPGAEVAVSDGDLSAYLDRHRDLFPNTDPTSDGAAQAREHLSRRTAEIRRATALEILLERADVRVEPAALASLVASRNCDAGGPPRPPGFSLAHRGGR